MKNPAYKERLVKTAFLETGVNIAHKVGTSLNIVKNEVTLTTTPIGLHVLHKSGTDYMVPYTNILLMEFLPEEPVE